MDEYGKKPDEMDEAENIFNADFEAYIEPEPAAASLEETVPRSVSYRKSGPAQPVATQVVGGHHSPAATGISAYYPDVSLYEEAKEETETRRKENRSFYRFIASVLILSMVGAPFLGLGFGLGVRFFDSYLLPILLDDTAERENFSFDNVTAPVVTAQTPGARPNYVELVQLVEPSVVVISASMPGGSRNNFFNFGGPNLAGSGIIMYETSTRYYIATNAHVIAGADMVEVSIAGSPKIPAMPVGRDDDADLAVIAVNRADALLQGVHSVRVARFGDSSLMQVGEAVVAIGNSMGEGNTVTNGIISAIDREIFVSDRHLPEVLQTNAAINQGNSGGPLVNLYGEVIGINTAKFSERLAEGMGYAIPSNVAMPILEGIMRQNDMAADQRPMIGIGFIELTENTAYSLRRTHSILGIDESDIIVPDQGLLITRVFPNSPAYRAGLQLHDIIKAVNGITMTEERQIIDIFSALQVGDIVTLDIVRQGVENITVEIVLGPHISSF
ncbi:MAG: trypsin-like peptidase domain-containing protein [Clostridiales bacterium]|jgi:serine protease Do|nr:trypsin-like peptidase domain-containing protein [Clostridiales bacterium]